MTTYALTPEQVKAAIAGHDLRTYKGWVAAATALLADAPYLTGIREGDSKQTVLKIEWKGKAEVVSYYDEYQGIYSEDQMGDFDSSAWSIDSWDGVEVADNIATLTNPVFMALRPE
ncbi:hypothetical protein [Comamonas testosteroni]|jgi:hypothetical protein|uniref:hypothetical protein n=1 Tax=Comamonas testosteroni TaxID=285 RepID=UPI0026ED2314|nr:hypothetical protein [Comamonas testosteroni]